MSEIKGMVSIGLTVALLLLIFTGVYLAKGSSVLAIQLKQDLFRFMVGQETNLRTVPWNEMETEHYQIKYLVADNRYVDLVAGAAEEAYTAVSDEMGRQSGRKTTIVIYPDNQSLAASFGWDKNEKALGVYWGGTIRILSPRAWLAHPGQQARFYQEGPMVHEFTHLMVDEMTRGNYNRWWTEGVAQYMERKITGFEFEDPFKGNRELYYYTLNNLEKNFDRLDQSVAYWESLQAVDFIVGRYGEEQIYAILGNLSQGDSMTRATEKALSTDYNTFARDFYHYLETYR